ncbi:enoyl-CoA hydratase-related protein [Actinomycetospora lutea]|uniref:enoyl-CoA hydratase-related protein n=1 Tax=Actinomycetospora lutea TaxID=663604 RepID=UPI0023665BB4|nr:enoyl-CoA hydratase-related protein [Actinomycetospora lutea]MDD7938367.1 enoyl-CoA hydratase-related protein [Actinomycetospora lutea]
MPAFVDRTTTGGTVRLTLCQEARGNPVSVDLLEDLDRHLEEIEADPSVRVVVLTGRGRAFSVGADLAAPPAQRWLRRETVAGDLTRLRRATRIVERLHLLPPVTVAAINGAAAGAGLALALACDLRVATDRAVVNTAFLSAGLPGDFGGIWFATHMLGAARARELFLLPGKLSAVAAADAGLVTRVVADEGFDAAVDDLARRLAVNAPAAARAMKQNLQAAATTTLGDYLRQESERMVAAFHGEEAPEAARAFLERRTPSYADAVEVTDGR